jgi:hypothetical protein
MGQKAKPEVIKMECAGLLQPNLKGVARCAALRGCGGLNIGKLSFVRSRLNWKKDANDL